MAKQSISMKTPYEIMKSSLTDSQLRAEYTRLRDIAQKRMKRLVSSGYKVPERYTYEAKTGFFKLSDIRDRRELSYAMANISEFLSAANTSIFGLRSIGKETVKTLREHGYTGITTKNLATFGSFMEKMRSRMGGRKHFPSGDAAQFLSDEVLPHMREWRAVTQSQLMEAFEDWLTWNAI